MSSYATFRLGDVEFGHVRNEVDDEVLAVFTDEMLAKHMTTASEYYPEWRSDYPTEEESRQEDYPVAAVRFVAPGSVIAARLDLMGVTATEVEALLERTIRQEVERSEVLVAATDDGASDDFAEHLREAVQVASSLSVARWQDAVRDVAADCNQRPFEPGSAGWMLGLIDYWEWRQALRLLLTVWPDEEVELDLTGLIDGGWLHVDEVDSLASSALASLRATATTHTPIVVLTEGRTDAEFLGVALRVLYPQLQDLVRFLDYEARPEGGAGALVKTVKAFAAAGIANRVVALLDNDAAARDALRGLDIDALPKNLVVRRYPDTELASRYPTLGPPNASTPGGHVEEADVNGLAGSIELYLGSDVLTDADGTLVPVQWRSYLRGVGAYQGEIIDKEGVHERFRAKVYRSANPDAFDPAAWQDLRSILHLIMEAVLDQHPPEHLCEHSGRSQTRIRVEQRRWTEGPTP